MFWSESCIVRETAPPTKWFEARRVCKSTNPIEQRAKAQPNVVMAQTNQESLLDQMKSHGSTKELGLNQPQSQPLGLAQPNLEFWLQLPRNKINNVRLIDFFPETSVCDLWALYYSCPDATHLRWIKFIPQEFASVHTTHSLTCTPITWLNNLWFSLGISL